MRFVSCFCIFIHFCSLVLSFLFLHNFSSQALDKNVAALDFVACQNVLEEGEHKQAVLLLPMFALFEDVFIILL